MAQWETLYLVAYSGEELNQSQLSQLLGVHGPTMLRMLDSLARRGLIERQQSHEDEASQGISRRDGCRVWKIKLRIKRKPNQTGCR
jgi:DNA-binding MarR family transcriptional regulator